MKLNFVYYRCVESLKSKCYYSCTRYALPNPISLDVERLLRNRVELATHTVTGNLKFQTRNGLK